MNRVLRLTNGGIRGVTGVGLARGLVWLILGIASVCVPASTVGAADEAEERPAWAGPVCDRAWDYQGELPRRSVPQSVWDELSSDSLSGDLPPGLAGALDVALDSLLALTGAPAIGVAVGIPGEGLWTRTIGVSRIKPEEPLPDTALFHAGSIGKAFTATLVMQLIEERQVDLGTSIQSWFHEYPNSRWITVDHLLTNTSGAFNFSEHKRFQKNRGYEPPKELIKAASKGTPRFCPGALWGYSNTGYVMLGRIVERLRGMPLQAAMWRDIIERLDLESTVPRFNRDQIDRHVTGHQDGKPLKKVSHALPHGAGIVSSTPGDLVRFWHGLLTGQLVSQKSVQLMCTDMFPMFGSEETHYGRGIMTYDVEGPGLIIGHGGKIQGYRSVVGYLAEDGVYVSVLANDDVPVEAALFMIARTLRGWRAANG